MGLPLPIYTVNDILNLPEGMRAELIDRQIYMMSAPSVGHQRIVKKIYNQINNYIESNNGSCEVFFAPFAVYLNGDDSVYVEPDISIICDSNKIDNKGCKGSPDWIIEVLSKSTRKMDLGIKLFKYRSSGVKEYWVVDEDGDCVMVYNFKNDTVETYILQDEIPVGIYKDLMIKIR